ncbi:MAG: NADH-quinone oxidoreductase subunit NuoK [Halobacteria archaeon]|nr:NADH-quinone oxidoreductase subunit NuoK [Halobacteria archaeon]
MAPLSWYIALSALLFIIGLYGVLSRRNVLIVLMCLELMLSAVNINLVAFSFFLADLGGQVFAIFVITVTAAEVAVALAIVIAFVRHKRSLKVDEISLMKG